MKWTLRIAPAAVMLLALAACAPADDADTMDEPGVEPGAVAEPAMPAELDARAEAFLDAWNQDDPNVIAAFFTDDAVVHADTMTMNGKEAILRDWLTPGADDESSLTIEGETWEPMGQDYRSAGRYTYTAMTESGEMRQTGTYETVWTHGTDGQWYVRSMTSTADPAAATTM